MATTKGFAELVGCALPLQLAGMGRVGASIDLPAAVSEAGGLGMIGAAGVPVESLEDMLVAMSNATTKPFGVNFLMPFLDRDAVIVASKKSRVVEFFYGDPDGSMIDLVHDGGALAAWQVGSVGEASAAIRAECDFIVAQGTEAGGHVRGKQALADLLGGIPLGHTGVPVLAAGGIGTAHDVRGALDAGAAGVRVGSRFLAARESIAHPQYIAALIEATASDTVITELFSHGWPNAPHRVLRSAVEAASATADEFVATVDSNDGRARVPRLATMPPTKDLRGNIAAMAMYAGTSVASVTRRESARDIVSDLCGEI